MVSIKRWLNPGRVFFYWACAKRWSGVLETPSWSGVLKTPSWSIVYDFSIDVFCKLGIVDDY